MNLLIAAPAIGQAAEEEMFVKIIKSFKNNYRGIGIIYEHDRRVTRVFYNFEVEDPAQNDSKVSGVAITKETLKNGERNLVLKSGDCQPLQILSLEAVTVSNQELGIYRFTGELITAL